MRVCVRVCVRMRGVCRASVVEESGFIPSQLETSEIPNKRAIVIDNMQDRLSRRFHLNGNRRTDGWTDPQIEMRG